MDENQAHERSERAIGAALPLHGIRQNTWDECSIEQKIERLRVELRGLRWAANDAHRLAEVLREHKHDALGEIMVPLVVKHGYGGSAEKTTDQLA